MSVRHWITEAAWSWGPQAVPFAPGQNHRELSLKMCSLRTGQWWRCCCPPQAASSDLPCLAASARGSWSLTLSSFLGLQTSASPSACGRCAGRARRISAAFHRRQFSCLAFLSARWDNLSPWVLFLTLLISPHRVSFPRHLTSFIIPLWLTPRFFS